MVKCTQFTQCTQDESGEIPIQAMIIVLILNAKPLVQPIFLPASVWIWICMNMYMYESNIRW